MNIDFDYLDKAIIWTLLYADVFDFPMTAREVHHFLIQTHADLEEVENALKNPSEQLQPFITSRTEQGQEYFAICERADHVFATRREREIYSQKLWSQAEHYGRLLSYLPFAKMVTLTGALSVRNPSSEADDLDYFLVAKEGRVWTARLMAVILVRLVKFRGIILCPNYVLAENMLVQSKQDSFIAHEIAQMHPLSGMDIYAKMRAENEWSNYFLPNAVESFHETDINSSRLGIQFKKLGEWFLKGWIGEKLEQWESRRKIVKLQKQIDHNSAAQLDKSHVKGHFQDHGQRILREFHARLDTYGLCYPALDITEFAHRGENAAD